MEPAETRVTGNKLALLQAVRDGKVPASGVAKLIDFRLAEADLDRVVVELDSDERHSNPMGTLHGGILCDIADAAMGMCFFTGLAEDESFTTLELKINFLRPVWNTRLRAEARTVQRGRSVGLTECDVTDGEGRLVARATSTVLTLRGSSASGR